MCGLANIIMFALPPVEKNTAAYIFALRNPKTMGQNEFGLTVPRHHHIQVHKRLFLNLSSCYDIVVSGVFCRIL